MDTTTPRHARWRPALEAAAVAVLVIAFYHTHLDLARVQSGGDFANLFWPLKEFRLQVAREAGVLPLWIPHVFMGSPHAATMQHAVFYPVDWLFFTQPAILPAMNLYVLAHLALAGLGAWFWARRGIGLGAAASILAGAAWPCTAWFWGAQEHINQVATIAWAPWLMALALQRARGELRPAAFVALYGGAGTLQFLVGHPQGAFYAHLASGAVLMLAGQWNARGARARATDLTLLGTAGAIVALAGAVQLLPALELSRLAGRHQFMPEWSYSYSMPPDLLATYLLPHRFGSYAEGYRAWDEAAGDWVQSFRAYNEYGLFVGVPVLALAVTGLCLRGRRRAALLLVAAIAGTLLMAMGGNASPARLLGREPFTEFPMPGGWSLHDLLVTLCPPAAGFRVPARIAVLTALAWVTLAGIGLEGLQRLAGRRTSAALGAVAVLATIVALYLPSRVEKFRLPVERAPVELARESEPATRASASLDDRLFRLAVRDHELLIRGRELATEQEIGAHPLALRQERLTENLNVPLRIPTVEGYEEGLAPILRTKGLFLHANRNLRQYRPDEDLLALLGVGLILSDPPVDPDAYPPARELSRPGRVLHRVPRARGAAFWAAQAEGVDFAALDAPHWPHGQYREARNSEPITFGALARWD